MACIDASYSQELTRQDREEEGQRERGTLSVEPLGPMMRWRRFTKRSLFRTIFPILIMSQAYVS
jgi:hypothetical protein